MFSVSIMKIPQQIIPSDKEVRHPVKFGARESFSSCYLTPSFTPVMNPMTRTMMLPKMYTPLPVDAEPGFYQRHALRADGQRHYNAFTRKPDPPYRPIRY